jgi:hypothetical protein
VSKTGYLRRIRRERLENNYTEIATLMVGREDRRFTQNAMIVDLDCNGFDNRLISFAVAKTLHPFNSKSIWQFFWSTFTLPLSKKLSNFSAKFRGSLSNSCLASGRSVHKVISWIQKSWRPVDQETISSVVAYTKIVYVLYFLVKVFTWSRDDTLTYWELFFYALRCATVLGMACTVT